VKTNPKHGRVNPDIFESDNVAKSQPVSYRTKNEYGGTTFRPSFFMAHALRIFYCRGALGTRVNPDAIGCVWTREFDLNTLRVGGKTFKSGKKMLRIKKYPDKCGRGLNVMLKKANEKVTLLGQTSQTISYTSTS